MIASAAVRHVASVAILTAGFACTAATQVGATGFYINQQGGRSLGRVDAGNVVSADDVSTIFFNPAGLTRAVHDDSGRNRRRIALGLHLIIPRNDQRNRGSLATTPGSLGAGVAVGGADGHDPTDPSPVPFFYWATPVMDGRGAIGFGFNAPFGLAAAFDEAWHGRYDTVEASLRTFNVSVVASRRFDSGLSIGGGLDLQYAKTNLVTALPNPLAPGGPSAGTDARIATSGTDSLTPGFNAGVLYEFTDEIRVGGHYRSTIHHTLSGTSTFTGLAGPLAALNGDVGAEAGLNLPAIATIGIRTLMPRAPRVALLGQFGWFDWSTFDEVRIRFDDGRPDGVRTANYRDAYAIAGGTEVSVNPRFDLRFGYHYDSTPTVDAYRDTAAPDSNRHWLGVGASYAKSDRLAFDIAFNHVLFADTKIGLTRTFYDGTPLASIVNINSDVSSMVQTIAVDFRYRF